MKGTLRVRAPLDGGILGQALPPTTNPRSSARKPTTSATRNGRDERKTRTTTVYSNMKYGQCLVEDQTGRVGIDFDGAEVEAVADRQRADRRAERPAAG